MDLEPVPSPYKMEVHGIAFMEVHGIACCEGVSTLEFCKGRAGSPISVCGMESVLTMASSRGPMFLSSEVQTLRPFSQLVLGCKGEMWGAPVHQGIVM